MTPVDRKCLLRALCNFANSVEARAKAAKDFPSFLAYLEQALNRLEERLTEERQRRVL